MKRRRLWKPGGRPRHAAGSMRLRRGKLQLPIPANTRGKEAERLDASR